VNVWLILVAAGLVTYATRLSFILLLGRIPIPEGLRRALRFVPPAVLTAIVFQETLLRDGALYLSPHNYRLLAAVLAGLVAWRTRNVVLTILAGMLALLLLQALFAAG
jgi:branched-subunit amino acid transport protein